METQFLKFTRLGHPLYIRADQIAGVTLYKVYSIQDGTYTDVTDALPVFEEYLARLATTQQKHCQNCKWWQDFAAYGHTEPLKRCTNLQVDQSCCNEPGEDGKDWGSSEYAVFYPESDFGCVCWEKS